VQPVTAVQTEYSVMNRDPEHNGVLQACEELGIGFVPWGPVGLGYLTGKIDASTKFDPKSDLRSGFDRFTPENIAANKPIVDLLKHVAQRKNATPAQVALAWLLAKRPWIVPIPGTRNPAHFQENVQAVALRLSPAHLPCRCRPSIATHRGTRCPSSRALDTASEAKTDYQFALDSGAMLCRLFTCQLEP
jgi:aryl-alcohol dehydrogenase-like predicted oxidoreductase